MVGQELNLGNNTVECTEAHTAEDSLGGMVLGDALGWEVQLLTEVLQQSMYSTHSNI